MVTKRKRLSAAGRKEQADLEGATADPEAVNDIVETTLTTSKRTHPTALKKRKKSSRRVVEEEADVDPEDALAEEEKISGRRKRKAKSEQKEPDNNKPKRKSKKNQPQADTAETPSTPAQEDNDKDTKKRMKRMAKLAFDFPIQTWQPQVAFQGIGRFWCGTSGYSFSGWRGRFYPPGLSQKDEFEFYSRQFNSLEINNCFYRLPEPPVWQAWLARAPPGYVYAPKMSRYLTHMKKLNDPEEPWTRFYKSASELKSTLGPILFQLPPNLKKNLNRLNDLAPLLPKSLRFVFEFREPSWYSEDVYDLLRHHGWAVAILPPTAAFDLPYTEEITSDFVYIRWHGTTGTYVGSYSDEMLSEWATRINLWRQQGLDVYSYFNNDVDVDAVFNAKTLMNMVTSSLPLITRQSEGQEIKTEQYKSIKAEPMEDDTTHTERSSFDAAAHSGDLYLDHSIPIKSETGQSNQNHIVTA